VWAELIVTKIMIGRLNAAEVEDGRFAPIGTTLEGIMTETHEAQVRRFYDEGPDGDGAGRAYSELMDTIWHHGDGEAERAGLPQGEAQAVTHRRLMEAARLRHGDWALDFGSGPGGATVAMADVSGAHFVGLSNAETLNRRARATAQAAGLDDRVSFITVDDTHYQRLPAWPDGTFDAVTALESICHLPDKQAFLSAAYRVLKPGGRLVVLDWLQRPFGDYQTPEEIEAIIGPVCQHIRLAGLGTLQTYADMMRSAGFEVVEAIDEWSGVLCWGSTPDTEREKWLTYDGPSRQLFHDGKRALDAARGAGVFTVGRFVAVKADDF
jgi:ubiquinone/menaquinone biosynthesis C-methylase UbiE